MSPDTLLVTWVTGKSDTGPDPQLLDVNLVQGQARLTYVHDDLWDVQASMQA